MATFMRHVNVTHRCYFTYSSNMLQVEGLNAHQHRYIARICRKPGLLQDELVRDIYVNKSNVARQLSQLEQHGFIRREPCPEDRRQLRVYPTKKAMDILPQVLFVRGNWNSKLLGCLTPEEQENLMSMMEKVAKRAEELVRESAGGGAE